MHRIDMQPFIQPYPAHMLTTNQLKLLAQAEDKLAELYAPNERIEWMTKPHPNFDGKTGLEMIAAGKGDAVIAEIESLVETAYA